MPRKLHLDLSTIADRVHPDTWHLFQTLRTRMRQMKGVTMELDIEKTSLESIPRFYYGDKQLFHLQARGEEINCTIHADENTQSRLIENTSLNPFLKEHVLKNNNWTDFTIRCNKDLVPFIELVKANYAMITEDMSEPKPLEPQPSTISF